LAATDGLPQVHDFLYWADGTKSEVGNLVRQPIPGTILRRSEMVFKPQTFHGDDIAKSDHASPAAAGEQSVADALGRAASLDASNVSVTAVGSTIVLQGTVSLTEEVAEAGEIAAQVAPDLQIENLITATNLDRR
jgi:hypothetical protein